MARRTASQSRDTWSRMSRVITGSFYRGHEWRLRASRGARPVAARGPSERSPEKGSGLARPLFLDFSDLRPTSGRAPGIAPQGRRAPAVLVASPAPPAGDNQRPVVGLFQVLAERPDVTHDACGESCGGLASDWRDDVEQPVLAILRSSTDHASVMPSEYITSVSPCRGAATRSRTSTPRKKPSAVAVAGATRHPRRRPAEQGRVVPAVHVGQLAARIVVLREEHRRETVRCG